MSDLSLTKHSALELAHMIKTRQASSEQVVREHQDQIRRVNPDLNAVVQYSESALSQAKVADAQVVKGEAVGVFHGVPFTVKDWIESEGVVCAAGNEDRKNYVPQEDASVVARMRSAGAILVAKTKPGSTADVYPAPNNPFNTKHTPGASSSGEAAVIAAGGSPLGIGSDSGGSLRWPAHCCGITTLKPSSGLIPNTGHVPPIIALSDPRTVIGPLARRVADLSAALTVMAGPDPNDASTLPIGLNSNMGIDISRLKIAFFTEFTDAQCDDDTLVAMEVVAEAFRRSGASVMNDHPAFIEQAFDITKSYWRRPESNSMTEWMPWGKSTLSADEIEQSIFKWDRLRRSFSYFMQSYDLILCPVASTPAPKRHEAYAKDYIYTLPFSLTGYPVVVIRAGSSSSGLPIGVQIVAKLFDDHLALAAAQFLESHFGQFDHPSFVLS